MLGLWGCGGPEYPPYSPPENLLSIAAEFSLLDANDPYRDRPAQTLTGQSIARATLSRLENYRELHPGRFDPEVAAFEARARERLGDFQGALDAWREVVAALATDSTTDGQRLLAEARRREAMLNQLHALVKPLGGQLSLNSMLNGLQAQTTALNNLAEQYADPYYAALARAAAERAEVARAELIVASRYSLPGGEQLALEALERLTVNHAESHRALEHSLRLAQFHRALAEEETRLHPPDQLSFDRVRFARHIGAARDLLYRITQADGQRERLIARHELDAVIVLEEITAERSN